MKKSTMYNTFSLSDVCCQSRSGIDPATTKPVGQNGRAVRRAASDIPNTALRWSWVSKSKVQGGVAVFFGSGNKFIHQPLGKILEIFEGSKTPFFSLHDGSTAILNCFFPAMGACQDRERCTSLGACWISMHPFFDAQRSGALARDDEHEHEKAAEIAKSEIERCRRCSALHPFLFRNKMHISWQHQVHWNLLKSLLRFDQRGQLFSVAHGRRHGIQINLPQNYSYLT